ncbi:unnamed protein product [Closterium sp. Yama58-4]|nr:unnamed protein product [Closterium sp. Yama58-4]
MQLPSSPVLTIAIFFQHKQYSSNPPSPYLSSKIRFVTRAASQEDSTPTRMTPVPLVTKAPPRWRAPGAARFVLAAALFLLLLLASSVPPIANAARVAVSSPEDRRSLLSRATSAQLTEIQGALAALAAGSPAFLLMASQSDLVTTLRDILQGNKRATILMPLPNAMDAVVGGAVTVCNGYNTDETTLYQIIDGYKSHADLLAGAPGTQYTTLLPGNYLVKNSASNATHVVLQAPSNERNATIVYPNLYKGTSFYVHGINNILVPDKQ